jgi:hypothetical protein
MTGSGLIGQPLLVGEQVRVSPANELTMEILPVGLVGGGGELGTEFEPAPHDPQTSMRTTAKADKYLTFIDLLADVHRGGGRRT